MITNECSECRAELDKEYRFCPQCGAELEQSSSSATETTSTPESVDLPDNLSEVKNLANDPNKVKSAAQELQIRVDDDPFMQKVCRAVINHVEQIGTNQK